MSKIKITISIDEIIAKSAKKQAIDENTNVSALIERLLSEHMSNFKTDAETL